MPEDDATKPDPEPQPELDPDWWRDPEKPETAGIQRLDIEATTRDDVES